MRCPCCNSKQMFRRRLPEPHFFCAACLHLSKALIPSKNYYEKLSGRSKILGGDTKIKNAERIKFLRPYLHPGARALEIGCAEGYMGEKIKRNFNVEYCGVEPSRDIKIAKSKLDRVWKTLGDVPASKSFDIILSFHVLEHIQNIEREITKLYKLLNSRGVIVIEVPHYFGNACLPWDFNKEHAHLFSPASLACLLERAGFGVVSLKTGCYESGIYSDSMRVVAKKKKSAPALKAYLSDRFKRCLGKKYVICGLGGDFASLVEPYIKKENILAVLDSSKYKIGKRVLGKTVQGLMAGLNYKQSKFLISTYRYQEEIVALLKKMGVKKTNIITLKDILKI